MLLLVLTGCHLNWLIKLLSSTLSQQKRQKAKEKGKNVNVVVKDKVATQAVKAAG